MSNSSPTVERIWIRANLNVCEEVPSLHRVGCCLYSVETLPSSTSKLVNLGISALSRKDIFHAHTAVNIAKFRLMFTHPGKILIFQRDTEFTIRNTLQNALNESKPLQYLRRKYAIAQTFVVNPHTDTFIYALAHSIYTELHGAPNNG